MKKIAILGASGQIGKGLTMELMRKHELLLFVRDVDKARAFVSSQQFQDAYIEVAPLEEFAGCSFDAVVSAIGPGDPRTIRGMGVEIFRITEQFDNLVLEHLERNPQVIYVYLSTGAVYGSTYAEAATKDSRFSVAVNGLSAQDYYPLAKLTAEAKHRTLAELLIADIRIFGYFSRHMKLDGGFFLSELAGCVLSGEVFRTDSRDFVRDYISSDELTSLVLALIEGRGGNGAYDIYSAAPVTKFELLHQLEQNFDLRFELETSDYETMAPLRKPARISEHRAAESIGYVPRRTSSEIVLRELEAMSRVSNRRDSSVA